MGTWDAREGSPTPLGVTWVSENEAYNFALYSKYADKVTWLLYEAANLYSPVVIREFDPQWKRVVDTYLEGPDDFVAPAAAPPLSSLTYTLQPRTVVLLVRSQEAHS